MAFESLSDKLQNAFKKLRSKGSLTEADVKEAMKEVKRALLEADVNFKVVKQFINSVSERAIGEDVLKGLNPGQMVIKIVKEEMDKLMGSETTEIKLLPSNEVTIIMMCGLQGAGKTTTMKMLLGLTKATSGNIKVMGRDIEKYRLEILPQIGSLIESPGFYPNLTGTENLEIFARLRRIEDKKRAIQSALELVNLPYKDKKLFSQYSLGMKQRLAIALSVMHDPQILILDEPINGLDPIGIAEVRGFIRGLCDVRNKTILISSHILSEISLLADDIGIIDHGELLEEESLDELKKKNTKYIHLTVNDAKGAQGILTKFIKESEFKPIDGYNIQIFNMDIPVAKLVRELVEGGYDVSRVQKCEDTLEDYFKKVTGGEGIA